MLLRLWAVYSLHAAYVMAQYTPSARWGSAFTVTSNTLYIHGGKTDPSNQFSYNSAPTTNDLIALDLSASWALDAPPWHLLSGVDLQNSPQGPALAWHTLTAFAPDSMLVFGGDAGPALPIATNPDSAWLLNLTSVVSGSAPSISSVSWTDEPSNWASEPIRRIYHSATAAYGSMWIVGGSKDDGSNTAFNETWFFDPSKPSFTLAATSGTSSELVEGASSMVPLMGHASVLLVNGTMVVFGGWSPALNALLPMTMIWMIDTTALNPSWQLVEISSPSGASIPSPRRNFAYALLQDGHTVLIHGGADGSLETVFADGWLLDFSTNPPAWIQLSSLISSDAQLGARFDHFALGIGAGQVLFGFGRAPNGPASPGPFVFDAGTANDGSGTWVSESYTPVPSNTLGNPPGWPGPSGSWSVSTTSVVHHTSTVGGKTITTHSSVVVVPTSSSKHSSASWPTTSAVSGYTFTSTNSAGSAYTSVGSTTIPPPTAPPSSSTSSSSTAGADAAGGTNNGKIIGIAVGSVVGGMTLALVAGALIVYGLSHERNRRWALVAGADDDDDVHGGGTGARDGLIWSAGREHDPEGRDSRDLEDGVGAGATAAGVLRASMDDSYGRPPLTMSNLPSNREKPLPMAGGAFSEWSPGGRTRNPSNGNKKAAGFAGLGLGLGALNRMRSSSRNGYQEQPAWNRGGRPLTGPGSAIARFDMLADEDERQFYEHQHQAEREFGDLGAYTGGGRRPGMGTRHATNRTGTSATSHSASERSVPWFRRTASGGTYYEGVMSSVRALGRSISGGGPGSGHDAGGGASSPDWWEKHPEFIDAEAGLLNDDEIGQRAAAVAAADSARSSEDHPGVSLVSPAQRLRGGLTSDLGHPTSSHSVYPSYASSNYRDPFADGPIDAISSAPLLPLNPNTRTSSESAHAASAHELGEMASTPFVPGHRAQQSDGAGSSTGPGTAAFAALAAIPAAVTSTRPRSAASTIASSAERGAVSDQSHASNVGSSSGSSGTGSGSASGSGTHSSSSGRRTFGRGGPSSADTQHTIMSTAPSAPIQRTNSWWSRFSALPLRGPAAAGFGSLDNRATSPRRLSFRLPGTGGGAPNASDNSGNRYSIDFRDPNPPPALLPALHAIQESGNTPDGSPSSPENSRESAGSSQPSAAALRMGVKRDSSGRRKSGVPSAFTPAGQSSASIRTTRTADSDMAEKMATGLYHVIRAGTPSHHEPSASDAGSMASSRPSEREAEAADELGELDFVSSPVAMAQRLPTIDSRNPLDSRNPVLAGPRPAPPMSPARAAKLKLNTSSVAARVAEFERRAGSTSASPETPSLPGGPRLPPTPVTTAAERREKRRRTMPPAEDKAGAASVRWSVTERQPLFVANPDHRRRDGSGETSTNQSTSG